MPAAVLLAVRCNGRGGPGGAPCRRLLGEVLELAQRGTFRTRCPRCGRVVTIDLATGKLVG